MYNEKRNHSIKSAYFISGVKQSNRLAVVEETHWNYYWIWLI